MGTCFNRPQENSTYIDETLITDKIHYQKVFRLALVGTKSSGKTTLINQLHHIHNKDINDCLLDDNNPLNYLLDNKEFETDKLCDFISFKTKKQTINDIRQNCVNNIITLCNMVGDEKSIASLDQFTATHSYLPALSSIISDVWNQEKIKAKYSLRYFYTNDYILDDNMDYFLDKIYTIMNVEYYPTVKDVLLHRSLGKSFKDLFVTVLGNLFQITDIGSVHSELYRKQLHWLSFLDTVVFVAALSDYARTEWFWGSQMKESIELFDMIVNSRYFRHVNTVLILSKNDIFRDCLKRGISMKLSFDDWDGNEYGNPKLPLVAWYISRKIEIQVEKCIPNDVTNVIARYLRVEINGNFDEFHREAIEFIKMKYREVVKDRYKQVYIHLMEATDTNMTEKVFDDIQHCTVMSSLQCGGII